MKLAKEGKVCLECNKVLGRFWGRAFCEPCFRKLLKEDIAEEDKRHVKNVIQKS